MAEDREVKLRISNSKAGPITFTLEPWGETYSLDAGDVFVLIFQGPDGDGPEVDIGEERITVWGWTGSTVRLFKGDEELGAGPVEKPRVPDFRSRPT